MGTAGALLGFVAALVVAAGWSLFGVAAARRWAGDLAAPLRWATAAVLALGGLLLTGTVLGSLGQLRGGALVAVAAAVGAVALATLRRSSAAPPVADAEPTPRRDVALVGGAVALVAVRWLAELAQTLDRGFSHADELHYHLTHSALFVQSGRTWPIRFTSVGDGAAYHPAHSELLHGIGMAVVGSDFLSIWLNLAFAALALVAGWSIGRHAGNPGAGALVVAAALSLPLVVAESGSALNDTMAIALLLVAVALLLEAFRRHGEPRILVLAGIAAGLAVGTKLTVLVAVGGLLLAVLAMATPRRWSRAAAFAGPALLAGGYWYLRNLVHTGNPVPALSFGPLPGPDLELQRAVEFPVLDYVADLGVWRDWLLPGLRSFWGPLWPLLAGLVVAGAIAALSRWRGDRAWALLAAVGLLSLAGYAATPTSAAGAPGEPALFQFNLRYAVPGALLCALAGLSHPAVRRRPAAATGLAGAAFVAANLHGADPRRTALAAGVVAIVAVAAAVAARLPRDRRVHAAAGVAVVVVALAVAVPLQDRYLDRRWTADLARWPAYEAGDRASGVAVGITGFPQSYPFFGADLDNRVVTLGDDRAGDELLPHASCDTWWSSVDAAGLDVVVVLAEPALERSDVGRQLITGPQEWLRAAGAPVVLESVGAVVYDVRRGTPSCGAGTDPS